MAHTEFLTVDDAIQKYIENRGYSQLKHFLLVSFAWTLVAQQTFTMVFTERTPNWHCNPHDQSNFPVGELMSNCSSSSSICDLSPGEWSWNVEREFSIVTEWGLVCGEEYKVSLVGSVLFTGFLIGAGVMGFVSDGALGRKGALGLSLILAALSGILGAFSTNYWTYLILRGVSGFGLSGASVCQYVLATEIFGPSVRGQAGLATAYSYSLGQMILPLTAYLFPTWRSLMLATCLPIIGYCFFILLVIDESPRWFLVHGQHEKSLEVLARLARENGQTLPRNLKIVTEVSSDLRSTSDSNSPVVIVDTSNEVGYFPLSSNGSLLAESSGGVLDLFLHPEARRRMFVMLVTWFTCAVVYYGISWNFTNLGGNVYLSTFLSGFIEWPAYILLAFVVDRVGRKTLVFSGFLLSGLSCLLGVFFLSSSPPVNHSLTEIPTNGLGIALALIGKFGIASSYALNYLYTGELFPTVVRNTALSVASQSSQIGTIAAPWVLLLSGLNAVFPFVTMGVAGLLASFFTLFLPETLNVPLLETLEGM